MTEIPPPYERTAIYLQDGPFNPSFMRESVRAMFRTLPLDPTEPKGWSDRRMFAALLGLAALNPRDEIEVMLGVQAMAAHHAAMAAFRIGMNLGELNGNSTRHISAACTAARTYDTMLRAIERRQAKPLSVPVGRPEPCAWDNALDPGAIIADLAERIIADANLPQPSPPVVLTPEEAAAEAERLEDERTENENKGLDLANTEGILPDGGMIVMNNPTPEQVAYMGRRLSLGYKREVEENRRNGITKMPKIRPIRTGDLIP